MQSDNVENQREIEWYRDQEGLHLDYWEEISWTFE